MIYYLIGIKGTALSALAVLLKEQGHIIKGVDVDTHFYTEDNLKEIQIEGFKHMTLKPCYFYIIGNAYVNHSVVKYIQNMKFYHMTYPEFIHFYFHRYKFLSVCGSHGKTTTTKMLTSFIQNCSYIIGDGSGSGKNKDTFVIEACEYRNTFLNYSSDIALILNIDYDHPDFFKTPQEYREAFEKFSKSAKIVVANGDDEQIRQIKGKHFITYGLSEENDVVFRYKFEKNCTIIEILESKFQLPFLGVHYAYDFVGAYLVAKLQGIDDRSIEKIAESLTLPKRRLEIKNIEDCVCIHDYAHHPTEIRSVYQSIKLLYPDKKIICIFQPHTLSRSLALQKEFKKVFELFDTAYMMRIFTSAREGVNLIKEKQIFEDWGYSVLRTEEILSLPKKRELVYAFLGAGDIDHTYQKFVQIQL